MNAEMQLQDDETVENETLLEQQQIIFVKIW
jgi:hypothetical protein